jgi:hypothetical protein
LEVMLETDDERRSLELALNMADTS